jgi:hypothetical protein
MATKELYSRLNVGAVLSLKPVVGTDDTTGQGAEVDLKGYGSALVLFVIGATGDTLSSSIKLLPIVEESDTSGSGYADAAANLKGALTLVDDNSEDVVIQAVAYKGKKRFIKPKYDFTGTHTNGIPVSIVVLRSHKGDL